MSSPFLTIVTRSYKKPNCLYKNIQSIKAQSDKDYEQLFIIDKCGHGLAAADQALNKYKMYVSGKFVMVLDDDDMIVNRNFIKVIKSINKRFRSDLIIWRGYFTEIDYILPPLDNRWGAFPVRTLIGSFNYCVKNELYNQYISVCTSGEAGDYDFLNAVFQNTPKDKIYWLNQVMVQTQQKSFGELQDISNG